MEVAVQNGIEVPSIAALRTAKLDAGPLTIVETLAAGSNYRRYIASYQSEGNTIYGLLTIPNGEKPATGWPLILFNHGYIPPREYRTTERYIAYTDGFSRNGYILFRSDYRGHGNSQGVASGGYASNGYTIDVLNALVALKQHPDVDVDRIGMWGHSMGGFITLRSMVVRTDIKAGVIWGGVVASYTDLLTNWRRGTPGSVATPVPLPSGARRWRQTLQETFGTPDSNPQFWGELSANSFLGSISGPVQLHHGIADDTVPFEFSTTLHDELQEAGKTSELYTYPGDDHDITQNFSTAMNRSLQFFDRYVKRTEANQ
jgi:dipeptidyl aminopeptidase/acylaminoacyl peptidase